MAGRILGRETLVDMVMAAECDDGTGDRLHAAPALVVRLLKRRQAAAVVLIVAEWENGAVPATDEQVGRVLLTAVRRRPCTAVETRVRGIARNITRRCDHRIAR